MPFSTARLALVALACSCVTASPYNMTVKWKVGTEDAYGRAWYGDGQLYIGPTVPSSVHTAFNFTVPNDRADLLYVEATGPGTSLAEPTFLAINNAPGAAAPVYFAHSAINVTSNDLIFWTRYANIILPIFNDGTLQEYFFLDATDTPGTYVVKWNQPGLKPSSNSDGSLVGVGVQLTAVNP